MISFLMTLGVWNFRLFRRAVYIFLKRDEFFAFCFEFSSDFLREWRFVYDLFEDFSYKGFRFFYLLFENYFPLILFALSMQISGMS
jgi:hypothetical protein